MNNGFKSTFKYKVIYVFTIYDDLHKGILKVGETTLNSNKNIDELIDNCADLNNAAKTRIRQVTNTIGVQEELLYTTVAINKKRSTFRDKDVHRVLLNSGIAKHNFNNEKNPEEWFETDLLTVKNAINAVKNCKQTLLPNQITTNYEPIDFRREQLDAIDMTIKRFKTSSRMLWNAKMRFGKTLSTLEVIKRKQFKKTIILTHRPVVDEGWFEDFNKIFYSESNYLYGSKGRTSLQDLKESGKNFIYFASIQDLRGSKEAGGKFAKNEEIFDLDWDFVVIDEAHEGTQTSLGDTVLTKIIKADRAHDTKVLYLSGTPFNLINSFAENEIYTWDYIMEQEAKKNWALSHPFENNPYEELPKLHIFTYSLDEIFGKYKDIVDKAFNFREFFRVWTGIAEKDGKELNDRKLIGEFVHKEDVETFINLLSVDSETSNYPFSKDEYRENFKHTFWILPGVKEAEALARMLRKHPIFSLFEIINVAGNEEEDGNRALQAVKSKIGKHPEDTRTITLSCGKLTTGVTVKPWSAVFYLAGSFSTSASSYLQTIFRVQSPASYDGKIKTDCYVFDFAPDRTLKMVAEAGDLSVRAGTIGGSEERMRKFLNFCPVIGINGSRMIKYNVQEMLGQLKKAYVERVVTNGFDDVKIYNDELLKLNDIDLKKFEDLKGIIGTTKQTSSIKDIDINNQGLTNEQYEQLEKASTTPKKELTEEQRRLLEELREKKKQKNTAISILRGISIKIPLLIYGANIKENEDVTRDNLTEIVDDVSWNEFMPKGVTKERFNEFKQYYEKDIFIEAGRKIRARAKYADSLPPVERAMTIANIFSGFKNPDKETVLTPWRTVNMHMGDTLGGYNFFADNDEKRYVVELDDPISINNGNVTMNTLYNTDSKILEINSKTGLYPLYVALSIFKFKCINMDKKKLTEKMENEIWKQIINDNIYVVCNSPMAVSITNRTLIGFNKYSTNVIYMDNLLENIKDNMDNVIDKVLDLNSWKKEGSDKMKFDAVVGNPPYQELVSNNSGTVSQANPVYNLFIEMATKISNKYVSMITPSLWMTGGTGLNNFRKYMLEQNHISIMHDYEVADDIFSNVAIAGGVSYFLWDPSITGKTNYYYYRKNGVNTFSKVNMAEYGTDIFIRDRVANNILNKVDVFNEKFISFMDLISTISPFAKGQTGEYDNLYYRHPKNNSVKMYRFSRNKDDKFAYIDREKILANEEWIDKHKVYVSKAGEISAKFNGLPFYGEPGSACSETYLVVGPFDSKENCANVIKYMNTTIYKYLIAQIKKSQNAARGVYKFVPMQDFSENSDIDWSRSIDDIDNQLYSKYKLSSDEIIYIEKQVNKK